MPAVTLREIFVYTQLPPAGGDVGLSRDRFLRLPADVRLAAAAVPVDRLRLYGLSRADLAALDDHIASAGPEAKPQDLRVAYFSLSPEDREAFRLEGNGPRAAMLAQAMRANPDASGGDRERRGGGDAPATARGLAMGAAGQRDAMERMRHEEALLRQSLAMGVPPERSGDR
jgi:hypothetical protein